jgi:hypothetical protein
MAKTRGASKGNGLYPLKCYLVSREDFRAAEDARMALAKSKPQGQQFASISDILKPGAMWFAHWWYDPQDPDHIIRREKALAAIAAGEKRPYLSEMYWRQWSDKRPPICVLTPSGVEWCVDARSSNGAGWTVTGDPPLITCAPSIDVSGYHGFLQNGAFTPPV